MSVRRNRGSQRQALASAYVTYIAPAVNGAHASPLTESLIEADHFLDRATSPSAAQNGDGLSRSMFVARVSSSTGERSVNAPYAPSAVYGRIVF
jgi:hypothetical protein